jgi:hypothetical protein
VLVASDCQAAACLDDVLEVDAEARRRAAEMVAQRAQRRPDQVVR